MLELDNIYCMDCLEGMKQIDDKSIDTIITDPPYGLEFMGKEWDKFTGSDTGIIAKPPSVYGDKGFKKLPIFRGFGDKERKSFYDFSYNWAKESIRVLKPGGTLLCFGGTRTYHRVACAVEDAGFILKDCIMWIYGSGFPKATDISKQLDKKAGMKKVIGIAKGMGKQNPNFNGIYQGRSENYLKPEYEKTIPATPEAQIWNGWKSHGLKPAYEPILVAMKPNDKTYANNALKWGVSGLNIDGGRIQHNEPNKLASASPKGRYPSNVILDEESAKLLDKQSGITVSSGGSGQASMKTAPNDIYGGYREGHKSRNLGGLGDKGGASRFFYCAKASKSERNAGCEGLEVKSAPNPNYGKGGFSRPTGQPEREIAKVPNNHPTVKPLKLMEYLCTLTKTPTGGIVLDPFIGSGTTALACRKTGRHFIGFEINKEYVAIANARLAKIPRRLESFVDKKEE